MLTQEILLLNDFFVDINMAFDFNIILDYLMSDS